ncbi:hypothetical protein [Citrobacter sp. Igbk 17]|uniref:hypothetical protein n=1 Tax=Citrobacter sp. Igbk 17 TaxID=2963957 RepID=UPI002304556C|nr:hypothetical protein [Citrobacter sp. Igbk 17]MDA8500675.1 hypothetical protein [Citrobacter sp. Igbk 17]
MDILIKLQQHFWEEYMSRLKKLILGLIILAGLISTVGDYKNFGLFGATGLFIIFLLTTVFLWQWASGKFPAVAKIQAIIILLVSAIASIFVINMAIAGNLHVDLMEVMRISITHNPLFYLILCAVAWAKVDIWKWLFSDLQSEQNQPL